MGPKSVSPIQGIQGWFEGFRRDRYVGALWSKFDFGGPWNLSIYGKGLQHGIFLDNGLFTSERIQVISLSFDFLRIRVEWGGFGSRCSGRSKFCPLGMLHLPDLPFWSVLWKAAQCLVRTHFELLLRFQLEGLSVITAFTIYQL